MDKLKPSKKHLLIAYYLQSVIHKIDPTTINNAKDLNLVMPVYKFLEYILNYSDTKSSLWFYY